ncbi:MAG: AAA family ATPase [Oligoflexia bacterium]|nr:AAA family ATPase [Oligoflexia bacterium]MBF0367238.1 AAA family ATPase [Oligoflexia bacterium]
MTNRGIKIAVAGKGGVGKTIFSTLLAHYFSRQNHQVYAIDADPDGSLLFALGATEEERSALVPLIEMKALIEERMGVGGYYPLNPPVEDLIEKVAISIGKIKVLQMGGSKRGGESCYCRENTFLQAMVNSLLWKTSDVVILDMGAGIEHLTRGTAKGVDALVIVVEPTLNSCAMGKTIKQLAADLEIKSIVYLANKIRGHQERAFVLEQLQGEQILGTLPYEEKINTLYRVAGKRTDFEFASDFDYSLQNIAKLILK